MTSSSIEMLYLRYRVAVFRYFYRMGGNYHLAEELTQETFYRAFLSMDGFRGESALSTWLFRIAFYVFTGHLRRHPRNRNLPLERDIPAQDRAGDPARAVEEAETRRLARLALQQLPVEYRAAIVLREAEGLTFEEIGAVLNKSPSTVRVTLCRAKRKYRQVYNQLTKGDDLTGNAI